MPAKDLAGVVRGEPVRTTISDRAARCLLGDLALPVPLWAAIRMSGIPAVVADVLAAMLIPVGAVPDVRPVTAPRHNGASPVAP